jgi:hypothetical protein
MRQVFTSRRLENVERVAEIMRAEGIEIHVSHGRSYKGGRRRQFSYRDQVNDDPQAAVWVIKAEDKPRARQILREAGLLESTRSEGGAFAALPSANEAPKGFLSSGANRLRLIVVLVAAVVSAMMWFRLG